MSVGNGLLLLSLIVLPARGSLAARLAAAALGLELLQTSFADLSKWVNSRKKRCLMLLPYLFELRIVHFKNIVFRGQGRVGLRWPRGADCLGLLEGQVANIIR